MDSIDSGGCQINSNHFRKGFMRNDINWENIIFLKDREKGKTNFIFFHNSIYFNLL